MAKKNLTIKINVEQIMHTGISVNKDGYKSARMLVKTGEKEYLSIAFSWEGDTIPGFVMEMMEFIKANEEEIEKSKKEKAEEFATYNER